MDYDKSVHCCTEISLLVVARIFFRALQFACLFYFVGGISKSCKDYKRSSYLFPILMFVSESKNGLQERRAAAAAAHTANGANKSSCRGQLENRTCSDFYLCASSFRKCRRKNSRGPPHDKRYTFSNGTEGPNEQK